MDNTINSQKKSGTIWPEKVYTQGEVDDLLDKGKESLPSKVQEIEKEKVAAGKQKRLDNKTVEKLVEKSNRILLSVHALFPFDFFPDIINIEEGRVTIIKRHFLSSEVHSVDIKDISNIFVNTTIFFSQLVIISKTFEANETRIRYLNNKDAIFIRRIIEGLRVFMHHEIDTSTYTKEDLIAKLEELSTTKTVT